MSDVDAILFAFLLALTISNLYLNICFQAKGLTPRAISFFNNFLCILSSPTRRVSYEI
jgi:hypothetical protein